MAGKYDALDHQIEWACFDTSGKPAIDGTLGHHMSRTVYDARGNLLEASYHGADGKLCNTRKGYAKTMVKYDNLDHRTEWACFDSLGNPAMDQTLGIHIERTVFDARGNRLEWTSY